MAFDALSQAATPLQAARLELGWKANQTIRAVHAAGVRLGLKPAAENSLKTMLSRWENGDPVRDPMYQRLFCEIYDQSPEELGFPSVKGTAIPSPRISAPAGSEMVKYFRNVFAEHLRADNLMGPHHLVDVVKAQAILLDQMLPAANGDIRGEMLLLALRYNEFAGWLYQDACNADQAMWYTDRAMDYALAIEKPRESSYVLMRKADIAGDLGNPNRAIGLTDAALRNAAKISARGRALVLRLRGRAYAHLGNASECDRALEAAQEEVVQDSEPDGLTDYCTPAYVGMEVAACRSTLKQFDDAIRTYETSLTAWPSTLRRDQGLCLARLSFAHANREDVRAACSRGREAVDIVRSAPSGRALRELRRLRVQLAPWSRDEEVSDLNDRIRGLFRSAA